MSGVDVVTSAGLHERLAVLYRLRTGAGFFPNSGVTEALWQQIERLEVEEGVGA